MSRVVVGLDGSAPARKALRAGIREAAARQAELVVVTVYDPLMKLMGEKVRRQTARELLLMAQRTLRRELAAQNGAVAGVAGLVTKVDVRSGSPAAELVAAADGADLLVVGSKGLNRWTRAVFGSTCVTVLREVRTPTLILPATDDDRTVDRIVTAVALDESASQVLAVACRQGALHGLPIVVLHSAAGELVSVPCAPALQARAREEQREADRTRLEELVRTTLGSDTRVDVEVVDGAVPSAIERFSTASDLLVVGHRHFGAWRRMVQASASERVVVPPRSPVLIVPAGLVLPAEKASASVTLVANPARLTRT